MFEIIGYGSMGKMLLWKFSEAAKIAKQDLFVSNRTESKLEDAKDIAQVVSNKELASSSDIVFVCVRPSDLKTVLEEIRDSINPDAMLVSLNGSVSFESIRKVIDIRTAKVIPSLTAEIGRSQTLVCFDEKVSDKTALKDLLSCIGDVIELPENEMGLDHERHGRPHAAEGNVV